MTAFVDTSALFALLDDDDPAHARAAETFSALRAQSEQLRTHSYVISESAALVQRRLAPEALVALFERLLPLVDTIFVDEALHRTAVAALLASPPTRVSLVDRVSFELMRTEGIDRAFAFDDDFGKAGFTALP